MDNAMMSLADVRNRYNKFEMKCIVPDCNGKLCGNNPIRSHAIQQNGIMSGIAKNGIVYCFGETEKEMKYLSMIIKIKVLVKIHLYLNVCRKLILN